MAYGKFIGGILGFMVGGPLGSLAGVVIGWLFDKSMDNVDDGAHSFDEQRRSSATYTAQQRREGQRNSFLFSLLVLAAYIIKADGKVMHSEMETLRRFLRQNFGEAAVAQGESIVLRLFEQQKQMGAAAYRTTIADACRQIADNLDYSQRLQLLHFLVIIAQADGYVAPEETVALREVAANMGITTVDLESMLNLGSGASDLEAAYKTLGVEPTATDDEVKAAYRKMALKHHPDRVATLGEDVRQAAEKKFQEINDAKEKIYKARGM